MAAPYSCEFLYMEIGSENFGATAPDRVPKSKGVCMQEP